MGKELKYITTQDHLSSHHKYTTDWNPQKFMTTANEIGSGVAQYIAKILAREVYPEQSYRSCSGVLNFAKQVDHTRLVHACKRADSYGIYKYGIIDQILRSKEDAIQIEDEITTTEMPLHDYVRGADYYEYFFITNPYNQHT
jgi:hypothetical protein